MAATVERAADTHFKITNTGGKEHYPSTWLKEASTVLTHAREYATEFYLEKDDLFDHLAMLEALHKDPQMEVNATDLASIWTLMHFLDVQDVNALIRPAFKRLTSHGNPVFATVPFDALGSFLKELTYTITHQVDLGTTKNEPVGKEKCWFWEHKLTFNLDPELQGAKTKATEPDVQLRLQEVINHFNTHDRNQGSLFCTRCTLSYPTKDKSAIIVMDVQQKSCDMYTRTNHAKVLMEGMIENGLADAMAKVLQLFSVFDLGLFRGDYRLRKSAGDTLRTMFPFAFGR